MVRSRFCSRLEARLDGRGVARRGGHHVHGEERSGLHVDHVLGLVAESVRPSFKRTISASESVGLAHSSFDVFLLRGSVEAAQLLRSGSRCRTPWRACAGSPCSPRRALPHDGLHRRIGAKVGRIHPSHLAAQQTALVEHTHHEAEDLHVRRLGQSRRMRDNVEWSGVDSCGSNPGSASARRVLASPADPRSDSIPSKTPATTCGSTRLAPTTADRPGSSARTPARTASPRAHRIRFVQDLVERVGGAGGRPGHPLGLYEQRSLLRPSPSHRHAPTLFGAIHRVDPLPGYFNGLLSTPH